ncbi:MAG: hypothetical protein IPH81_20790 [Candidatus Microthrix sp.]|nr:hypothetical protein [Candidatus Microthrix sp.]
MSPQPPRSRPPTGRRSPDPARARPTLKPHHGHQLGVSAVPGDGGEGAIPVGTAYAVWGAIGAIGTVIAGIVLFNEPVTFWRMFFLSTLVVSVVGLQVVSGES